MPVAELLASLKQKMITKYGYKSKKMLSGDKFLYAPGTIPVMVIAHLDTVHTTGPETLLYDSYNEILVARDNCGRATGLGADDRAGVWAIVCLLERGFRPHILWTDLEEKGCQGAKQAAEAMEKCPPQVKFMVEFDRMHSDDCVFYQCDNRDFVKHIETYGFKEAQGSSTDICKLMPVFNTAGVNLSIGYYHQHTNNEMLLVKELDETIRRATHILADAVEERVPHFPFCEKKYGNTFHWEGHEYNVSQTPSHYSSQWREEGDSRSSGKRYGGTPGHGKKHGQIEKIVGQTGAVEPEGEGEKTAVPGDLLYWERVLEQDIDKAEKEWEAMMVTDYAD